MTTTSQQVTLHGTTYTFTRDNARDGIVNRVLGTLRTRHGEDFGYVVEDKATGLRHVLRRNPRDRRRDHTERTVLAALVLEDQALTDLEA
jgi:hypothetical protein